MTPRHIITVTRDGPGEPPVLRVYSDGKLVVSVPLTQWEAIHLIAELAIQVTALPDPGPEWQAGRAKVIPREFRSPLEHERDA